MGRILRAVARRGAVGGTARWAAKIYDECAEGTEELELDRLCATLVTSRYDFEATLRPDGSALQIRTVLGAMGDAGEIRSICHVVVLILAAEAGLSDNHPKAQVDLVDVVASELLAKGVPPDFALGEDSDLAPGMLWSVYLPSLQTMRSMLQAITT